MHARGISHNSTESISLAQRAAVLFLLIIVSTVAVACKETLAPPGQDMPSRPGLPVLNLDGHYRGDWSVYVFDPVGGCGGFGWGSESCSPTVEYSGRCDVVSDFKTDSGSGFTGTFSITEQGCVDGVAQDRVLKLDLHGNFRGPTIDSVRGSVGEIRFMIGEGTREDLEHLVGCTLRDPGPKWEVWVTAGDARSMLPKNLLSQKLFIGRVYSSKGFGRLLFNCKGRDLYVEINVYGEQ